MGAKASCGVCGDSGSTNLDGAQGEGGYDDQPAIVALATKIEAGNNDAAINKYISKDSERVGDHYVPRVGDLWAERFKQEGILAKCIGQWGDAVEVEFGATTEEIVQDLTTGKLHKYSIALSDPDGPDCPLIYVSPVFEDITGYASSFCLGRSCRFLQPTNAVINTALNAEDKTRMREFCTGKQQSGTTIINLLLNERKNGTRFWNLLKMMYAVVEGKSYIFAMQTEVDTYMPRILRRRTDDRDINDEITKACSELVEKLAVIRRRLKYMSSAPLGELHNFVHDQLRELKKVVAVKYATHHMGLRLPAGEDDGDLVKPSGGAAPRTLVWSASGPTWR